MTTHYSCAQLPEVLQKKVNKLLEKLVPILVTKRVVPVFCYSGMSGVAIATAISLNSNFPHGMIYVRKRPELECCHGKKIEYNFDSIKDDSKIMFVFVDDFIMSGTTIKYTMDTIKKECDHPFIINNVNRSKMIVATIGTNSDADDTSVYPVDAEGYNKIWESNYD